MYDFLYLLTLCKQHMLPNMNAHLSVLLRLLYNLIIGPAAATSPTDPLLDAVLYSSMSRPEKEAHLESCQTQRDKLVICKSVSSILYILLKITKAHHILEFEHVCSVLADVNCPLIFLKLLVSWFPSPATAAKANPSLSLVTPSGDAPSLSLPIGDAWLRAKDEPKQIE